MWLSCVYSTRRRHRLPPLPFPPASAPEVDALHARSAVFECTCAAWRPPDISRALSAERLHAAGDLDVWSRACSVGGRGGWDGQQDSGNEK